MADRRHAQLTLTFDGQRLQAVAGESIAATLIAHGILAQGVGKDGAARGHYCGMGVCHDCLVTVDGRAGVRACMTKVADGMQVRAQHTGKVRLDEAQADLATLPTGPMPIRQTDVLVVGAGPAGLRAALAAAQSGAQVLLMDERSLAGGQYFKQAASAAAPAPDGQMAAGAELIAAVRASGVVLEWETLVFGVERGEAGALLLSIYAHGQASIIRPRALIIATGAYEQPTVVPGWTMPGVMTPGAAQTLWRSYGVVPGRRVVLAGNGPLNLQVARELAEAGCEVTVVEAAPAPWTRPIAALRLALADPALTLQGLRDLAALRKSGAQVRFNARLIAVEGQEGCTAAMVSQRGVSERIVCDIICASDGFAPAADLARLLGLPFTTDVRGELRIERGDDGATEQPDVFVVGEAGGFGGAHIAGAMGALAGLAAAEKLGFQPNPGADAARRALARHRRFQRNLWSLFEADASKLPSAANALACRCEAVSRATLADTVTRFGVRDASALKRLTRAGMGRCQGRYCAQSLRTLTGAPAQERALPAPQIPVRPVPLAALAIEKAEWGGHRRANLPAWTSPEAEALPVKQAQTVIIGAGVAGLSTALFLARAGHDVVVLDRNAVNSGASGGNAGSLHAQLLSFDHGSKAEAGGGPAARTLPLQLASIALWRTLEQELAADFEISISGGLMVAESEAHLRFIEAKTAVERAQGIDCSVISRADLRRLEPALDERFVGAAFCPQEGKINPLVATQGLYTAALAAGARVFTGAQVIALERAGAGFRLVTNRGDLVAGRLVNAAGGFASRIGAMLNLAVPVFGAPLQMIVTEPAEPLISRLVAHADRHLTLKQAANGNFIIGGGWTAGLDPIHGHPRPQLASIEGNLWVAQHVVPALRRLHVLRSWAAMNINIDGAPILGEHPTAPGFFNCVTSNGYTLGPLMGQMTAALVNGDDPGRDLSPFLIERFG